MPDTNPDAVKLLSDDEVAEIAVWKTNSYGSMVNLPVAKRDALCATVRTLREKYDSLKSKIAWHRDGVGPDVPVLQERYDRLITERNALRTGLHNIYHVITDEECDAAVALGMATSAVSSLLNNNTALREQLAEARKQRDSWERARRDDEYTFARIANSIGMSWCCMAETMELESRIQRIVAKRNELQSRLAQVTQERDDLLESKP